MKIKVPEYLQVYLVMLCLHLTSSLEFGRKRSAWNLNIALPKMHKNTYQKKQ